MTETIIVRPDAAATPGDAPVTLTLLGDSDAAACVGDVCEVPTHREHAIISRRLDDDAV